MPERAEQAVREERRWATLLFADLSGFTKLAEQLDPEDVKALAHRCTERLGEEVKRFGGTVITIAGDQVVAAFGAPVAHGDDAERAVRAALAMRDCPLQDNTGAPIKVHVGLNTGDVMAGLIGPREHQDYAVMGDTTNVAARLMGAAPAGSVLVGEETWRATKRVVRYRELPPLALKGKERPVPVWEALEAESLAESRPLGSTPMVGRDQELALLSDIWLKVVREGRPHLITIRGEPGIGKSRLVAEFERKFCEDALVLHGRCLPYGEALGYWALTAMIKEAAGIRAADDAAQVNRRLADLVRKALGPSANPDEAVELTHRIGLLTGLNASTERAATSVDQRTLHGSVRRFLESLARQKPLCLSFEDIHWADAALLDMIEFVASRSKEVPLLILAQARPGLLETRPNWGGAVRAFISLPLEPLSDASGSELIRALCRERSLPEDIVAQVGKGAGGNPLFVEELVLMIAERGSGAGVPSAIKALIAARLDSLPSDQRQAIQIAAVFGKTFWAGGLRALGLTGDLPAALEALEHKDLLRFQPHSHFSADQEYSFKHDLIRDVAYETLPRAERRTLHGSIADWLEQVAAQRIEIYYDQLAHHALHAGQEERAIGYLVEAAQRARRMSAHVEEAKLLLRASEIAGRLGQTELRADLLGRRGTAFVQMGRWAEARADLENALAGLPENRLERRAEVLRDLGSASIWLLETELAQRCANEALQIAEKTGRETLTVEAMALTAMIDHQLGNLRSALGSWDKSLQRAQNAVVPLQSYAPHTLYLLGEHERGIQLARTMVDAFQSRDAWATMQALPHLGLNLAAVGRYQEAAEVFEQARRHGREYESWSLLARSNAMSSGYRLDLSDFAASELLSEEAREMARSANFPPAIYSPAVDLLFNYVRRGELGRAEALFAEVQAGTENSLSLHRWLWRHRLAQVRAEMLVAQGKNSEAIAAAAEAVKICRTNGRVKYEVLGMVTQALALRGVGRTSEAVDELTAALERARLLGDPVGLLRILSALLPIAGNDALLNEAKITIRKIDACLPDEQLRKSFQAAEPVRLVETLAHERLVSPKPETKMSD